MIQGPARENFPTIFRIALDYLPIQASSVPSERVFSSSAETDTVRRNRISPVLMEALQMLKFSIKQDDCFNFTAGLLTTEKEMQRLEGLDKLVNQNLLGKLLLPEQVGDQDDIMDTVIKAIS